MKIPLERNLIKKILHTIESYNPKYKDPSFNQTGDLYMQTGMLIMLQTLGVEAYRKNDGWYIYDKNTNLTLVEKSKIVKFK